LENTDNKTGNKFQRAYVLGYPVDLVTKEVALDFAQNRMESGTGLHVVTINPEIILAAEKNPELDAIIKKAELIIPDSTGMELALRRLGFNIKKLAGIEFSEALIERCSQNNYKIAFLGASQEVIEQLQKEFKSKYPEINIVYARNGYFSENDMPEITGKLKELNPHLLLVALGAPKQEYIISKYREILLHTTMIGVGGSFDVWAKKVKRAPVIFRMFGLEWLYRLIKQPSRFNRMFPALPLFILRTVILGSHSEPSRNEKRKEY
jgi:N-acetylglucosaminyldiphosphoundecaprenol N-acetyl-beta-D-mannosaminyltransferase